MFRHIAVILGPGIQQRNIQKWLFMSQMCNGRVTVQILRWLESVHSHMVIASATGDTRIPEDEDELLYHKFVCSQMTTYDAPRTALVNPLNHFNICILPLPLHIYHTNSNFCIFLRQMPPWGWPKKTETCIRTATCLYIYSCTQWQFSCCSTSGDWWQ
jgi:hypothetical protein